MRRTLVSPCGPRLIALALVVGPAPVLAQAPSGPGDPPAVAPTGPAAPGVAAPFRTVRANNLTNRYRFSERHHREDDPNSPGSLGTYRVGLVEVTREAVDQPQGAPRRSETTRETVFVERASEASGLSGGGPVGSVRFIERYRVKPDDPRRMMGAHPLDGLSVALRYRAGEWPSLVSLTAGRKPTDYEAEVVTRQMAVAQLGALLPSAAVRVGDTWRVNRRGAQALLGDPSARGDTLEGTFVELRREENGPRLVALLRVAGRVPVEVGEAAVNAEVQFTFGADGATPPADASNPTLNPVPDAATGRGAEGVVEARGGFTEVRLAWNTSGPVPGPGRLRFQAAHEVTMDRQLHLDESTLPRPAPAPNADDPTAPWLVWIDPARRFRLEHPQDLAPPERSALAPLPPGSVVLVRSERGRTDLLQVDHVAGPLTIDDLRTRLKARTSLMRTKVTQGEEGWLPEADWHHWRVYRIEAAVDLPATRANGVLMPASRVHFDAYLIQTGQAASVVAIATTSREPVAAIRREFEQCLGTIRLDVAPDLR